MDFFEEATLRLKQQMHTTQDKEIASVLGLSAQSWAGRKKRGNFPEKELRALAQQRPELQIDVDYVLTGEGMRHVTGRLGTKEQALADAALTAGVTARERKKEREREAMREALYRGQDLTRSALPAENVRAEVSDEARLLAAFRASNSAGRAAILLAARGIAGLAQE